MLTVSCWYLVLAGHEWLHHMREEDEKGRLGGIHGTGSEERSETPASSCPCEDCCQSEHPNDGDKTELRDRDCHANHQHLPLLPLTMSDTKPTDPEISSLDEDQLQMVNS